MDPNFWPEALRDVGLLLTGGLLAYGSGSLSARRTRIDEAAVRARTDAAQEVAREAERVTARVAETQDHARRLLAIVSGLQAVTDDYAEPYEGWAFPPNEVREARDLTALVLDEDVRTALESGWDLLGSWQLLAQWGEGEEDLSPTETSHQRRVLNTVRDITASLARGESPDEEGTRWLIATAGAIDGALRNNRETMEEFYKARCDDASAS